ncbi:GntR family transcriptional regulator [Diaphorobacter caeni]|uniref:GntR family transcriptional regulator n=1 Tax=Diaphorobacter caeni TaxID=2784387 RepID=UPI001890991F|nr:GntR family transcriptional regulator [Diaphorobacter caeni]
MARTQTEQADEQTSPPESRGGSASGSVFYGIMKGLETQSFVPGQRLVEVDLAAQYGVSRNSVREALQRLAAEGVIELSRNKGAAIRSLTLKQTHEVLDVAERMTGLLARSAAQGIADGQSPEPITQALRELVLADQTNDGEAFARARRSLYRAFLVASDSQEMRRLFPSIQMPIVYAQHRPATLQKVRMRDYQTMSDAILAGNAAAADKAGMAHVQNVRAAIVRQHEARTA